MTKDKLKLGTLISTDLPDRTGDVGIYIGEGADVNGHPMRNLVQILWLNKKQTESIFVSDLEKYFKVKLTGFSMEKGIEFKK